MQGHFRFLKAVGVTADSWMKTRERIEIPAGCLCTFEAPRSGDACVCLDLPSLRDALSGIPMPLIGRCLLSAPEVLHLVLDGAIRIQGGDPVLEESVGVVSFLD